MIYVVFSQESDGTNSYFRLVGVIKDMLDKGGLFIVDEIDAHLLFEWKRSPICTECQSIY